ncbi:GNAT family N-acetyltransferase [Sphingomonas sp. BAUL-RG-20F-R05-02]|uniref:GNAT family N-acetyltransferase n=1 Tax=unclassified Sphingomonas TaxID=196159 RepID=UPI001F56EEA1|nr:GNAT family N-acetyltransferase [Sphingomonas sp. BAUL-RG-20F-R05-02]
MITYRDARAADAAALSAMARQSFVETFGTLYSPSDLATFLDDAFGANGLAAQLSDPEFTVRLAVEGDAIIAFAKMGPVTFPGEWRPDAIELYQFYVLAPWQGQGIAQEMMEWAIFHARDHGAREIILSVYVDNHRARRFYERYGFEEIGAYAFQVGETIDDDRLMRLAL